MLLCRSNQRRPAFPGMKRGNTPGRAGGRRRRYPDPVKRRAPESGPNNENFGAKGLGDAPGGVDDARLAPGGIVVVPRIDADVEQVGWLG